MTINFNRLKPTVTKLTAADWDLVESGRLYRSAERVLTLSRDQATSTLTSTHTSAADLEATPSTGYIKFTQPLTLRSSMDQYKNQNNHHNSLDVDLQPDKDLNFNHDVQLFSQDQRQQGRD